MSERVAAGAEGRASSRGLIAVGHAGSVTLLDAATGRVIWECSLAKISGASACDGQPVSVRLVGSTVVAGAMGHVFAFAVEDGSVLWHVDRRSRGAGTTSLGTEQD